jgi:hypothetical protein
MTTTNIDTTLLSVINSVKQGSFFDLSADLADMINCSANAVLVFRRIPISLIRDYWFDETDGFREDFDKTGLYAIAFFYRACQHWDLPDDAFKLMFRGWRSHLTNLDKYLNKFGGHPSHLYWKAIKIALNRRLSNG